MEKPRQVHGEQQAWRTMCSQGAGFSSKLASSGSWWCLRKNPSILRQDRRIPLAESLKQTGMLPHQRHRPRPLPAARGFCRCVLLGHAVVAPRGPPACGCVHSVTCRETVCSLGVSHHAASPYGPVGWESPSSRTSISPRACGNTQPARPSPGPLQDS